MPFSASGFLLPSRVQIKIAKSLHSQVPDSPLPGDNHVRRQVEEQAMGNDPRPPIQPGCQFDGLGDRAEATIQDKVALIGQERAPAGLPTQQYLGSQ